MSQAQLGSLPHRIHLVGIGGIGLSAIARVLAMRGHAVSGSDLKASPITKGLDELGIRTSVGHAAEQIEGAELVVISSAIPESNPEVQAARKASIPVVKRRALLGRMMTGRFGIAVAGTHGKTTTSAMISVVLERSGLMPTFIVGGIIVELGTNARAGRGQHFAIEADEYDRTFHGLTPQVAVVTNVEMDHPDCYRDIEDVRESFGAFLDGVPRDGHIIACADSPELMRVLNGREGTDPRVLTYGLEAGADYVVHDVLPNERGGIGFCVVRDDRVWGAFALGIPGAHNALNATAALIVASVCGIDAQDAGQILSSFQGVLRRFEVKGEKDGVLFVDDYAHHPTEIRATLAAARLRYPQRRLWAVFQPHTYSRTRALLGEFATCFADAHRVIVTDIYAARQREKPTIRAEELIAAIVHDHVQHIATFDEVVAHLMATVQAGDLVLTLDAGDGYLVGERLMDRLSERENR